MATSGELSTSNQYVKYTISVSEGSYSIASNSSPVTVSVRFYRTNTGYTTYGTGTVYCVINGQTYTEAVTPSQKITNSGIVLFSKTVDVIHDSNGSKRLTCSAWITHNAPLSSSEQGYSQDLAVIPRKSTLSVANGTLNTAQTLSVTRQYSGFTHTITAACSGSSVNVCDKSGSTSISFTPPLSWASKNTTGTSVSVTYSIDTYNGSSLVGSESYSRTCAIPSSIVPKVSFTDTDPTEYAGKYGGYVQSLSKVSISITAEGAYGSTVYSYSTTVNGKTYTGNSFTTDVISGDSALKIVTTVTDSRGRTATASSQKAVLAYSPPKITALSVQRSNVDGANNSSGKYLKVTFDALITPLSSKNMAAYSVQYKQSSAVTYTTAALSKYANVYAVSGGTYIFPADTESSYNVILTAADTFGNVIKTDEGGTTKKLFSWLKNGLGFAFGKVAETVDLLEIAFDTQIDGDLKLNRNGVHSNISSENNAELNYNTNAANHVFNKPIKVNNRQVAYVDESAIIIDSHFSGSTLEEEENGWIKYADGHMIQWMRRWVNTSIDIAWGNIYESPKLDLGNWFVPWVVPPIVTITPHNNLFLGCFLEFGANSDTGGTNTKVGTIYIARGTPAGAQRYALNIFAIGRWK